MLERPLHRRLHRAADAGRRQIDAADGGDKQRNQQRRAVAGRQQEARLQRDERQPAAVAL